ncbi:protein of unknown function (DUF1744) [Fragilaria crotonensis]|nr:protein of unknown function (DUF1744) [Fragilaria crotonensis]
MGRVFGQSMGKKRAAGSGYQRQFGGHSKRDADKSEEEVLAERRALYRRQRYEEGEALDVSFGYTRYDHKSDEKSRRGWIFNMLPTTVSSTEDSSEEGVAGAERSALDLYFRTETGSTFKSTVIYSPYFFVIATLPSDQEDQALVFEGLVSSLMRLYEANGLSQVEIVYKVDLDQVNHLSPSNLNGRPMIKLVFDNVQQLMDVRKRIQDVVRKNKSKQSDVVIYNPNQSEETLDPMSTLEELREYDVPYLVRVCTDLNIRAGAWYTVTPNPTNIGVTLSDQDVETKASPSYMAFDIECTKAPLKFPDANHDSIFMISYMVEGQGYLILSRSVVSQDVQDFEYTPKPGYPGPFHIFNELTEEDLLKRFFEEYKRHKPQIVVTYNGDFFDWPYVEQRAAIYGLDIVKELGVEKQKDGEYRGRCSIHLDAFHWVQRDSYLPQGSQGLKAVTKYKLGYDPVEVDPEDMVRYAQERPVHMATYSVSDAVATYYLYEKYVHMFIFSLCTIIPMGPEDVLRKGSGTLCEVLLMVQACEKSIICPNKQTDPLAKFHNGHLLESETYIGGKVECLETGVYRSDVEYEFDLKPAAFQMLINNIDRDLTFAIEVELGGDRSKVTNYNDIRSEIVEQLEMLRDRPKRTEKPYIYHLDVGAMYPNIILTNRLQPSAIVDDATCAACDFNQAKNDCKRRMDWVWRGDYTPATKQEYDRTKDQLSREIIEGEPFSKMSAQSQADAVANRLKTYARNAYRKVKITEEVTRSDTVCMRENDFYVDTVRRFRDRRYELKKLTKTWQKKIGTTSDASEKKAAEDRAIVYDSLQVAHKCILNSFYGYVMRKGARWRSMEMAGIVTKTGADLITQARILVEQIGRPLELDTDGIWCILPKSFPDVYNFNTVDGGQLRLEYPCVMLNADIHENFTNHQYQVLRDPERGVYETRSECSIFFEVDGPYRCMVLPASTEEGKLLKKRYAVFNFDGSLAELKGFELKRRGELELIKTFQSQVFQRFLDGDSLKQCYASVADVANHWIDVLDTQGESLDTDELFDLISENRSMSRQLEDYGDQKGTSQTTARRLGEFLGAEIIKDKGLNCKFVIAEQPYGAPVTERAIPTAIWKAEPAIMKHYLRKWLKAPGLDDDDFDIRNILDWKYYIDRLAKSIQKIITIPAALQKLDNPVPRIPHPDWLLSKMRQLNDHLQQANINSFFKSRPKEKADGTSMRDMEDFGIDPARPKRPTVHRAKRRDSGIGANLADGNITDIMNIPKPTEDRVVLSNDNFNDWLAQRKSLWRVDRRERNLSNKTSGFRNRGSATTGIVDQPRRPVSSMEGYIREAALALRQNEWHVIEVRELSSSDGNRVASSGEFIAWVMIGSDTLRKIQISVPRVVYITTFVELKSISTGVIQVRKVDKHLPHNKTAKFVYEVTMPEHVFKANTWIRSLCKDYESSNEGVFESLYESSHPLMLRALTEMGCVVKTSQSEPDGRLRKNFQLDELQRVHKPAGGDYLHSRLQFKKIFIYHGVNPRTKAGIVAVFVVDEVDESRLPQATEDEMEWEESNAVDQKKRIILMATATLWIVKPGSAPSSQKGITKKQCQTLFSQLLKTIYDLSVESEANGQFSEYSSVSLRSECNIASLNFVNDEMKACAAASEVINARAKGNNGPTFVLVNSGKSLRQLRSALPSMSAFPVISMPFPPGPAHNPSTMSLPALNWEQPALQLVMEAYFFIMAVSFPKRIEFARYGHIPIGNFGEDECTTMYDVSLSRQLEKSRALSWANPSPGRPDLGFPVSHILDDVDCSVAETEDLEIPSEQIWGDEDDVSSPVVCKSGSYRTICVEIDVHDLAIAALTDMIENGALGPASPTSVGSFGAVNNISHYKSSGALGDDMCTSISLPLLRVVVGYWLRDAFDANSKVADDMLHNIYRLVSSPDSLMSDPVLHRTIHSMMKTTFLRLLGELQRLGCTVVFGSFHKITVATNKSSLSEAEEYIQFVISTIGNKSSENGSGGIERVSLRPSRYYSHVLFFDEYNYGGIELERRSSDAVTDDAALVFEKGVDDDPDFVIFPSVVSGWSIRNYLGSEMSQEYFRAIVGRFSKDVFRKEQQLRDQRGNASIREEIVEYKRKVISKHFASDLARALDDIVKETEGQGSAPRLPGSQARLTNPPLEFIKSVSAVLELDTDVQNEVQTLKRGLLAQIGVAEYSQAARWENPSAVFTLSDLFCVECHESRDVNLCELPPLEGRPAPRRHWSCDDCGTFYDPEVIERRLISIAMKRALRYQLQDVRCSKTNRVATRALCRQSVASAELKLDITRYEVRSQLELLHHLALHHELAWLEETTGDLLGTFADS